MECLTDKDMELIRKVTEDYIPFNTVLGLKVHAIESGKVSLRFDMKNELVGNFNAGMLHGGVISAVLDVAGGMSAFAGVLEKHAADSLEEKQKRFAKLGTIDIRIDYLRPGKGTSFLASGVILRTGNKVAVTRMELHNQENLLIAVGTGTYLVG
ncbi:MAG: thioesterase family protein [SAR324 cluster bacterium]|nr:thioesterase family protein [SAR324 cluster bacterium]